MKRLESEIERSFVRQFNLGYAIKLYEKHWPDRLIITRNGRHAFIEFKRPGGRLSEGQKTILKQLRKFGHSCLVAYSAQQALEWIENEHNTTTS